MNIAYTPKDGFNLPDLALPIPEQEDKPLGKYALMRLQFLRQRRRGTYMNLLTTCQLRQHLQETQTQAENHLKAIVYQMAEQESVNEQMKASDPMKWTGLMNQYRKQAEETIQTELIYR